MFKVCIAGPYPAGTMADFRAALPAERFELVEADTQEKFDAVTDADAVVLRVLKMPKEAFARFTRLRLVMRWGTGYDSVDVREAGRRGIAVCNTPGANAHAVAELAVGLMIDVGRNIFGYYNNIRSENWDRNVFSDSFTLNRKMVGLIGGGNIGRQVARRVQAFGAQVQYYDAVRLPDETEREYQMRYTNLETLVRTSDIVSLHVPLLESTRHIIGAPQLAAMRPNAILINTARGGLVDDAALVEALGQKRISGAGLDCVEQEDGTARALSEMINVVLTPHIGGSTSDLGSVIVPMIVQNLCCAESGEPLHNVVNAQYLCCGV